MEDSGVMGWGALEGQQEETGIGVREGTGERLIIFLFFSELPNMPGMCAITVNFIRVCKDY